MRWFILFAIMLLVTFPVAALEPPVLGSDGTIFRLIGGTYGDLFPDGIAADSESPVLALEVTRLNDGTELLLVPGTESQDREGAQSLILEDRYVYVVWESLYNDIHPLLRLTSFDGANWSEVIEILSSPFARKGSPQLEVTRETSSVGEEGVVIERTILHLSWWEETAQSSRKLYTPIILLNGVYSGYPPIFNLSRFATVPEEGTHNEVSPGIVDALALAPGEDSQSVVVGFFDGESQSLVVLRLQSLPLQLSDYVDKIGAEMILIGHKASSMATLAQQVSAMILELGDEIHIAVRTYMAEQVAALIAATPDEELTAEGLSDLADKIGAEMILIGHRMEAGGLVRPGELEVLEIGPPLTESTTHLLGVTRVFERAAPPVNGPAKLFLSRTGTEVLLAWDGEDEGRVYYRESMDEGWSDTAFIELGDDIDRETAYQILARRERDR